MVNTNYESANTCTMEKKNEQKISSLLEQFLSTHNLKQGYAEYRVKKYWSELLGKNVDRATRSIYVKDNKLFVKLHSSVMRNELAMMKGEILQKLNEKVGMQVIEDIILR